MQHVTVTEYDPRWEKLFEEEKKARSVNFRG